MWGRKRRTGSKPGYRAARAMRQKEAMEGGFPFPTMQPVQPMDAGYGDGMAYEVVPYGVTLPFVGEADLYSYSIQKALWAAGGAMVLGIALSSMHKSKKKKKQAYNLGMGLGALAGWTAGSVMEAREPMVTQAGYGYSDFSLGGLGFAGQPPAFGAEEPRKARRRPARRPVTNRRIRRLRRRLAKAEGPKKRARLSRRLANAIEAERERRAKKVVRKAKKVVRRSRPKRARRRTPPPRPRRVRRPPPVTLPPMTPPPASMMPPPEAMPQAADEMPVMEAEVMDMEMVDEGPLGGLPGWVLPVGGILAAGGLVFALTRKKGKSPARKPAPAFAA